MLGTIGFLSLLLVLLAEQALAKPIAQSATVAASSGQANRSTAMSKEPVRTNSLACLNAQWKRVPGEMRQVQVDGSVVCGVTELDKVYCADKDIFANLNWFQVPGQDLVHVSISDGRLHGIDPKGLIWYGESYKAPNWRKVYGEARVVDLDFNFACVVVLLSENVYCAELGTDFTNPQWFQVPGQLRSVSVSHGRLYGVNSRNQLLYLDNYKNADWKLVTKSGILQAELRGRIGCAVNDRDEVLCASGDVAKPQWIRLNGSFKQVSVSNGELFALNRADQVHAAV